MHALDIGDEVVANGRTGQVMDLFTHGQAMVQWDDEAFCRLERIEDLSPAHSFGALFTQPKQRRSLLGWTVFSVIAGLLFAGVLVMAAPAKANLVTRSGWQQPYGGCKEASRYTHSQGARECRQHGWIIRPRLIVNPRGYVVMVSMPKCRAEDGSYLRKNGTVGLQRHCFWDARAQGNGLGHSFVVDHVHGYHRITWLTFKRGVL